MTKHVKIVHTCTCKTPFTGMLILQIKMRPLRGDCKLGPFRGVSQSNILLFQSYEFDYLTKYISQFANSWHLYLLMNFILTPLNKIFLPFLPLLIFLRRWQSFFDAHPVGVSSLSMRIHCSRINFTCIRSSPFSKGSSPPVSCNAISLWQYDLSRHKLVIQSKGLDALQVQTFFFFNFKKMR